MQIKIVCECGQHYAFDVEPMNGRLGSTIACPACGADGTGTANAIIASKSSSAHPPTLFPEAPTAVQVPAIHQESSGADHRAPPVPHGVRVDARTLGLVDRETAKTEARAKMSWGDSQEDVIKYLLLQGYTAKEASDLVKVLFKERLAALPAKEIKKMSCS
jgi:hypothetical protein